MTIGLYHYLGLGAALFAIGIAGVVTRRNAIGLLIGVELMLNAANINLVGFSRYVGGLDAQVFALFVIVLAAAEAAVALAIILQLFDKRSDVDVDRANTLKG
ncbi:MAG: NADH-quinone oxidoreductase subunit NuoK [Planctomycetaceae bacterium]